MMCCNISDELTFRCRCPIDLMHQTHPCVCYVLSDPLPPCSLHPAGIVGYDSRIFLSTLTLLIYMINPTLSSVWAMKGCVLTSSSLKVCERERLERWEACICPSLQDQNKAPHTHTYKYKYKHHPPPLPFSKTASLCILFLSILLFSLPFPLQFAIHIFTSVLLHNSLS